GRLRSRSRADGFSRKIFSRNRRRQENRSVSGLRALRSAPVLEAVPAQRPDAGGIAGLTLRDSPPAGVRGGRAGGSQRKSAGVAIHLRPACTNCSVGSLGRVLTRIFVRLCNQSIVTDPLRRFHR